MPTAQMRRLTAPMLRRFWLQLHLYLGLSVGAVFVLLGLTGSLLVFYTTLDYLALPAVSRPAQISQQQPLQQQPLQQQTLQQQPPPQAGLQPQQSLPPQATLPLQQNLPPQPELPPQQSLPPPAALPAQTGVSQQVITPSSAALAVSPQAILDKLRANFPARSAGWRIELPLHASDPVLARYLKPAETRQRHFAPLMVTLDPHTLQITSQRLWGDTVMTWIYDLHYTLLLHENGYIPVDGKTVLAIISILLLISLLSGVYLWWPQKNLPEGKQAASASAGLAQHQAGLNLQNQVGLAQHQAGLNLQNQAGLEQHHQAGLQRQNQAGLAQQNPAALQPQHAAALDSPTSQTSQTSQTAQPAARYVRAGRDWRKAFAYRRHAHLYKRIYDWHKLAGVYGLLLLIVLVISGLMLEKPAWFEGWIGARNGLQHMGSAATPPEHGTPLPAAAQSLDQMALVALAQFPGSRLRWIYTPDSAQGQYQFRLYQAGEPGLRFPKTTVQFDLQGKLLGKHDYFDDSAGDKLLNWLHPLHNGEALGLPGRWLVLASGLLPLLLFVTGWLRWRHKRRAARVMQRKQPTASGNQQKITTASPEEKAREKAKKKGPVPASTQPLSSRSS